MKYARLPGIALALTMLVVAAAPAAPVRSASSDKEAPRYSAEFDLLRQQLRASGPAGVELAQAEYFTDASGYDAATSQTIIANDRIHLIGSPTADITHGGWLPGGFFNAIAPGGASSILGVTFTFIFTDENDNNGFADVAFRELYCNRGFGWGTNGSSLNVDIESVATHEAGHAFGLNHFGKVLLTQKGTTVADIKYAPRAVMNAVYISPLRDLTGADTSGFCSIWADSH